MSKLHTILERHELVDIWPGKQNAYRCVCLSSDNTKYEANIPKAECEMTMYLKSIEHKLTPGERYKLKSIIVEFGDERYEKGSESEAMNNEDI